ncbi:putative ATP-dependent RNA helicase DHR1 [Elasticomyces elasticus]|nr:putative ATP-dependent RNA helicase DHR1 [Elasticomyces elasticus]
MAPYVARERKKKRLAKRPQPSSNHDPVPDELIPETISERESRRAKLAEEIREQQPTSKVSSKKRKRLDHYIDTKLRKEENLDLLKKLAAHKVDTSLLQSSKRLGQNGETKRERISRALREKQAGIDDGSHDKILFEQRRVVQPEESDPSDSELPIVAPMPVQELKPVQSFGSGLKRPLDTDDAGKPVITKRQRRKVVKVVRAASPSPDESDVDGSEGSDESDGSEDEDEWGGFSSDGEPDVSSASIDDVESDESSASDEDDDSSGPDKKERVSAFKQWATTQRNTALDFVPSALPDETATIRADFKPREHSPDAGFISVPQPVLVAPQRPTAAITISRTEEIQAARLELPVVQEEQKIMEAINGNPIVIICGATGSGKTTQVPQMMFENGYGSAISSSPNATSAAAPHSKGMIGVTQPRRVAATSVASRVSHELGSTYGPVVAHQVRYDSVTVGKRTAIKFMTDGILLREIEKDFLLSKYSAIVIDEAHERSVNTDILIGMLSRIVPLRAELALEEPGKHYPLKLVIMSATLRVTDFTENKRLFRDGPPPIVEAEGRQFPVTVHFSRRTQRDYTVETVEKVARGHRKLPPGGMLVFLTSQQEILEVTRKLKERLGGGSTVTFQTNDPNHQTDDFEDRTGARRDNNYLDAERNDDSDSDIEITGLDPDADDAEFRVDDEPQFSHRESSGALKPHILPLYAALPSAQQLRVFQTPPADHRLIVLATNVAETSLTIPGIRYVFDCGRAKEKHYDIATGVQTFEIDWISKASASQRTGRAGRTGPGHCYRLYSSAVYERYFADHTVPEILRSPLEGTVLQLKAMDIENVVNFPFPTRPDAVQLAHAEKLLSNLGAIAEKDGRVTATGKEIMGFPVSPRFGKMLLLAQRRGILAYAVATVAALAVGELFIPEAHTAGGARDRGDASNSDEDSDRDVRIARKIADSEAHTAGQQRHQAYTRAQARLSNLDKQSDVVKLLTAVAVYAEAKDSTAASKICNEYYLREKGMSEVQQLRHQLHNIVSARYPAATASFKNVLPKPSKEVVKILGELTAAGFIDQVAIRADLIKDNASSGFGRKPRRAGEVAYRTLVPIVDEIDRTLPPQDQEMQRSVFVHPSSTLAKLGVSAMPDYVVYSHLSRAAPATIDDSEKVPRTRMHPLTTVSAKQLALLAEGTPLLEVGKPIGKIEDLGTSRQCWVSLNLRGAGWPLPPCKVLQRKSNRGDWEIEKVIAR